MSGFEPITGGCLCGTVRYEVSEPPFDPHYCHCRICQKISGAPAIAGAFALRDAFRFTKGEPKLYKSSSIVERCICADCGTYLLYRPLIPEWSDWVIFMIASLDLPESLPPKRHYGVESQLAWFNPQNDLPGEPYEDDFIEILADPNHEERATVLSRFGSAQ